MNRLGVERSQDKNLLAPVELGDAQVLLKRTPFFQDYRVKGVPASRVPDEIVEPLIERVFAIPEAGLFKVSEVFAYEAPAAPELPAPEAASVQLLGDFTEWQASSPMRRVGDGSWRVSLDLAVGREYAFRYLVDGERWVNDSAADRYAPNPFGTENSIVVT